MLEGLGCGSVVASRGKGGETGLAVVLVRPARERKFAIAVVAALVLHFVAFGQEPSKRDGKYWPFKVVMMMKQE